MTSDRYISLGKWQVHFTWSTNDFRFGTRVAWLAQERCIEFDEEISGAQVLPGPMTICIAKRAFFAASGSPEAPWPEWKSCAFHLRSHPVSKPTFAARIAWRKAKDLTNQIEWSNHIKKTKRHRIYHIKTYTLLQFVLISWDNQLRFPFWDRTFLLKAKCTAVLQVSHRWLKPIPLSGFWDCFSKTQLCRQCQGHFLYMFSRTVTCLSACSHQFSIMVPVVFEVCFFKRVMFYSCFVHLARLKFVAFLEDFSAWFSFSRCFSLLASWVRHWCKDLDQLRSYAWDLTKKKTRSHTWSVHVIKDIRVSWETAKDRCTVLTFEKF